MLDLESIAVDVELEQNGQFVEIPDWERVVDGQTQKVELGVRSLEIPAYKTAIEKTLERLARQYKGATAPPEVREVAIGRVLADTILFGWKGIKPDYSPEVAKEFLTSTKGREFAKKVIWAAGHVAKVEAKFEEDAVKN